MLCFDSSSTSCTECLFCYYYLDTCVFHYLKIMCCSLKCIYRKSIWECIESWLSVDKSDFVNYWFIEGYKEAGKRRPFAPQKGTFYNAKEHLLFFSIRISITLCPDGPILVLYVCWCEQSSGCNHRLDDDKGESFFFNSSLCYLPISE